MPQNHNLSVAVVVVVIVDVVVFVVVVVTVVEEIKGNLQVYNLAILLSIVNKHVTFNSETSL